MASSERRLPAVPPRDALARLIDGVQTLFREHLALAKAELKDDNLQLVSHTRETHTVCDEHRDVATASLLENWIDEAEGRVWFLHEASRRGKPGS